MDIQERKIIKEKMVINIMSHFIIKMVILMVMRNMKHLVNQIKGIQVVKRMKEDTKSLNTGIKINIFNELIQLINN